MTREEAIFYITELQKTYASMDKKVAEAVDMAIEALANPKEEFESADAVSREDTVTLSSPISIQAEMVAVVRCKDCRHYGIGNCYMYGGQMNEDDFCSYGERREE